MDEKKDCIEEKKQVTETNETLQEMIGDIIAINCIGCKEFRKPLSESTCLCESIYDMLSNITAGEWEKQRKVIVGD